VSPKERPGAQARDSRAPGLSFDIVFDIVGVARGYRERRFLQGAQAHGRAFPSRPPIGTGERNMDRRTRIVLFSEVNSKFGWSFLLELLASAKVEVAALVTSPVGTLCPYYIDEPEPVDLVPAAQAAALPILRPQKVNAPESIAALAALGADYFLIANYQQIFGSELLGVPKLETLNFHPSPLPRYAGLAPFYWMAKHGEREGGVSAIVVNTAIDGGDIVLQIPVPMTGEETALEIRHRHFDLSIALLRIVLAMVEKGELPRVAQDLSRRSYFGRPSEDDCTIDWTADSDSILRTVRAAYPWPGAVTTTESGERWVIRGLRPTRNLGTGPLPQPGTAIARPDGWAVATRESWLLVTEAKVRVDGREFDPAVGNRSELFRFVSPARLRAEDRPSRGPSHMTAANVSARKPRREPEPLHQRSRYR
jgi:methionyl-tRNA formyltransferase